MAPMKDSVLYDMTSQTSYEVNMFAADLLIDGKDIHALSQEDMDYFNICKCLYATPDVMSFKLFCLIRRGHAYDLPIGGQQVFGKIVSNQLCYMSTPFLPVFSLYFY